MKIRFYIILMFVVTFIISCDTETKITYADEFVDLTDTELQEFISNYDLPEGVVDFNEKAKINAKSGDKSYKINLKTLDEYLSSLEAYENSKSGKLAREMYNHFKTIDSKSDDEIIAFYKEIDLKYDENCFATFVKVNEDGSYTLKEFQK